MNLINKGKTRMAVVISADVLICTFLSRKVSIIPCCYPRCILGAEVFHGTPPFNDQTFLDKIQLSKNTPTPTNIVEDYRMFLSSKFEEEFRLILYNPTVILDISCSRNPGQCADNPGHLRS